MDEFDLALMEALNEAVPPADFATDLASRLVARTHRRTRFWKMLLVLGLFSAAATPVRADGYQYIVSGYPAANPSHSDVSSGTSLAVGVLGDVSAAAALEARARTCDDSAGTALRSDEFKAMIIIFK